MTQHLTYSQFRSRARGIPCIVDVTYYDPGSPAKLSGHPDSWEPSDPEDIEVDLLDSRGRPAPWLTAKMSDADWAAVYESAITFMERRRD